MRTIQPIKPIKVNDPYLDSLLKDYALYYNLKYMGYSKRDPRIEEILEQTQEELKEYAN